MPWSARKEEMEMAKIPVIPVAEDEHIFHERPPPVDPDASPEDAPIGEPPPEEDEELPPEEEENAEEPQQPERF